MVTGKALTSWDLLAKVFGHAFVITFTDYHHVLGRWSEGLERTDIRDVNYAPTNCQLKHKLEFWILASLQNKSAIGCCPTLTRQNFLHPCMRGSPLETMSHVAPSDGWFANTAAPHSHTEISGVNVGRSGRGGCQRAPTVPWARIRSSRRLRRQGSAPLCDQLVIGSN